jgi:hypothetical protein
VRADWMVEEPEDRAREATLLARLTRAWLVPLTPLDPGADADGTFDLRGETNYVEIKSRDLALDPPTYPTIILAVSKVRRLCALPGPAYFILHAQRTDTLHLVRAERIAAYCTTQPFTRDRRRPNGRTVPADHEAVYCIPVTMFTLVHEPPQ